MDKEQIAMHWREGSERDFRTMRTLFDAGDNVWALFLGHISLEKLIKALIVKRTGEHPPFMHDLTRLAARAGLEMDDALQNHLDEVTTFNIRARYDDPDEDFSSMCTTPYTADKIRLIEELRGWIISRL